MNDTHSASCATYIHKNALRKTLANITKRIKNRSKRCLTPSCTNTSTQKCHVISKSTIKKYTRDPNGLITIAKDRFNVMFPDIKGRKFFKQFRINDQPTFYGFCNRCDTSLFFEADNYEYIYADVIPDIVLIQMHYRQICYGLVNLQEMKIINEEILSFTKENHPNSESHKTLITELIPNTEKALYEHQQIKESCEQHLNKIKNGTTTLKMPKILIKGKQSTPLCFGRIGYYIYQYVYSEERLLKDFFHYHPFATFSSIITSQGKSHLVFTSLPENAAHLVPIIRIIDRHDRKDILANMVYNFSDGCLLKLWQVGLHGNIISKTLNHFIENSGLI